MQDPLEQGLKHKMKEDENGSDDFIRLQDPIKQGVKRQDNGLT